jgi:nitrogen regulatory protein PII
MKLLLITAVSSFENEIKVALKKAQVAAFSYTKVTGYKDLSGQEMDDNWFTSSIGEHDSIVFYAFVQDELVDSVIEIIDTFNEKEESYSHIHVAAMDIVKQNKF